MLHLGQGVNSAEQTMARIVSEELGMRGFAAVTAADVPRTSDFLHKIIDLIRGSGFSIAIFSDRTPARTLANIFFEVGMALVFGKPVPLVWTGRNPRSSAVPSDFVRTEWIRYVVGEEDRLRCDMGRAIDEIEALADYYRKIGDIALDATEPDLELAFERYKQAVLISADPEARERIIRVRDQLSETARQRRADADDDMASHRTRLLQTVSEFVGLLPQQVGGA